MSVGEHWRPFLGEHPRSLDAKGRVILPARFREKLEGGGVMVSAIDGCLSVYTMDAFETFAAKVAATREQGPEQRDAARAIFAGSTDFVPDRQGRIAIPPKAKAHAGLERDGGVVGNFDHFQIWDARRYAEHDSRGSAVVISGVGIENLT